MRESFGCDESHGIAKLLPLYCACSDKGLRLTVGLRGGLISGRSPSAFCGVRYQKRSESRSVERPEIQGNIETAETLHDTALQHFDALGERDKIVTHVNPG